MRISILKIISVSILVILTTTCYGCTCATKTAVADGTPNGPKTIEITALIQFGEPTRYENLLRAGDKLNEKLEIEKAPYRVKVTGKVIQSNDKTDLHREIIARHGNKTSYDIYALEHGNIGWLADQGFILPTDEIKELENYRDLYPPLWEAVRWHSQLWAIPQDSEARVIFYDKSILRKMGWPEADIEDLPRNVARGSFTNSDLLETAQAAVGKGLCQWGFVHRSVTGPDFLMSAELLGAELYDEDQHRLVFHRSKMLELLQFYRNLSSCYGITPENMTEYDRDSVYAMFLEKKQLFWAGGLWHIYDFMEQSGQPFNVLMKDVGVMLYPAYEKDQAPITLTNPFVYVISSDTEQKDVLLRLFNEVADPELQGHHAVTTYHLPITRRGAHSETFQNNYFLKSNLYMLDYAIILPNHPGIKVYESLLFDAVCDAQTGLMSPEDAAGVLETKLKLEVGTDLIIIE